MKNKKIEIQKSKTEKIIIEQREFNGKQFLDLRIFYKSDDNEYLPTKKGLTMSHDLFHDFYIEIKKLYNEHYNTD